MSYSIRSLAGFLVLLMAGAAFAQGAGDVDVVLDQRKILVAESGKEQVSEAKVSKPGDVIEYVATYRNRGKDIARKVSGTLPVPDGMQYAGKSSGLQPMLASLDGNSFSAPPLRRSVRQADGSEQPVEVPASEYKALRWALGDLAPGKSISVSARMRLNPAASPAVGEVTSAR